MNHWQDYWNGGNESSIPEDNKGIYDACVAQFWQPQLINCITACSDELRVLEVACGNGGVTSKLFDVLKGQQFSWTASDYADISADNFSVPSSQQNLTIQSGVSAAQLPYDDGAFDVVVSQFGIEYAGEKAFSEALRVLKPEGTLLVVCHSTNSKLIIEHQNALQMKSLVFKFIEVLKRLANDPHGDSNKQAFRSLMIELSPETKQELSLLGLFQHIENFFRQILTWSQGQRAHFVGQMHDNYTAYFDRVGEMVRSAQSESSVTHLAGKLSASFKVSNELQYILVNNEPVAIAAAFQRS